MQRGYWMKPHYFNGIEGGWLAFGPLQINWYYGLRVYLTWPGRTRALVLR